MSDAALLVAGVRAGKTLTSGLATLWQRTPELSGAHRGAVQDLAYGTLRDYGHGERQLAPLLRSIPADPVYSLLLVALHRLEARPESAHTIVDQCVHAAAAVLDGRFRGLANAVLRNHLRAPPEAQRPPDPVALHRHPAWWIARLRKAYPADYAAILAAGNGRPPMALRTNLRRTDPSTLVRRLTAEGIECTALGATAVQLATPMPVTRIPGFAEGECSVQDPGAQHAAGWLDLRPGQRVLDACAAPGGKTAHILESCDVALTALELAPERLPKVQENLARLGLSARLVSADCAELESWWDGRPFDRILADVPCSASGVVRRHPDIKWLRREEDLHRFAAQQARILARLWHTLAPGGKMLYATCSVFPEENSMQIERFVRRHPDARHLPLPDHADGQLLPCAQHDGFFYALLEKTR